MNKQAKIITATVILAVCAIGYAIWNMPDYRYEKSDEMTETGEVVTLVHSTGRHESYMRPGIDFDGNVTLRHDTRWVPPKWGVMFKCQHGSQFVIYRKVLYDRFKSGQKVTITYKEEYKNLYEDNEMVERRLIDFDFIDAIAR